ncbi:hypothetical protein GCM10018793_34570 [Streptomyces sulfonofaciens]|uniref:Antitoxin n=1 Tax=Streptomyces sulfonofaciens TaxID=68272 RepID=A0A919GA45_9ACTN|nr:hypothetical protein GCM10018793_34570 [Streptomyces sulfonofaciens]
MNFSELVNENKRALARLRESPRLLVHRRDGGDLVLTTAARAEQGQDRCVGSHPNADRCRPRREPGAGSMELPLDIPPDAFPGSASCPGPPLDGHRPQRADGQGLGADDSRLGCRPPPTRVPTTAETTRSRPDGDRLIGIS